MTAGYFILLLVGLILLYVGVTIMKEVDKLNKKLKTKPRTTGKKEE